MPILIWSAAVAGEASAAHARNAAIHHRRCEGLPSSLVISLSLHRALVRGRGDRDCYSIGGMNSPRPNDIYGHRARIGYVCPPQIAEVFPYEFYKIAPAGVTLVITTLAVIERSASEVDAAYAASMRAARELAAAGVDVVFLGGVPINISRGADNAQELLGRLAVELGVAVSSSTAAQEKA